MTDAQQNFKSENKLQEQAGYALSDKQLAFCRKAKREGMKLRFDYSGRGMYGRCCPAVSCDRGEFGMKGAAQDQLGMGIVVYMP